MASQNTVNIMRQWSKTLGVAYSDSTDALFQLFKQLNASISDNQNTVLTSATLTAPAATVPGNSAFRVIAGGVYQLVGASQAWPALGGPAVTTTNFGMYWFTVDNAGVVRTYNSPGNNSATRAALLYPSPLPGANEAVIGMIEVAPSGATFTPGTTNLNAANINATAISLIGDSGFTAFTMVDFDVA